MAAGLISVVAAKAQGPGEGPDVEHRGLTSILLIKGHSGGYHSLCNPILLPLANTEGTHARPYGLCHHVDLALYTYLKSFLFRLDVLVGMSTSLLDVFLKCL